MKRPLKNLLRGLALSVLVGGCLSGCKNPFGENLERAVANHSERVADVVSVDSLRANGIDTKGSLSFVIDTVFLEGSPLQNAPWHREEGDWTFFSAHLAQDADAVFTFGYQSPIVDGHKRAISRSLLAVHSTRGGDHFLRHMSADLGGALPPLDGTDEVGKVMFNGWQKGENFTRQAGGAYSRGAGSWRKMHLFLEHEGRFADLAIAFDFETRAGEFVEADSRRRDQLMMLLGSALRGTPMPQSDGFFGGALDADASSPERGTPQLRDWRVLWPRADGPSEKCDDDPRSDKCRQVVDDWGFCPGNEHAFFTEKLGDGRSEIRRTALNSPGASALIGRTRGRLYKIVCLDRAGTRYMILDVSEDTVTRGVITSQHPRQLWHLNTRTGDMDRLRGAWDGHRPWIEQAFLSPHQAVILVQTTHRNPENGRLMHVWYHVHLASRSVSRADLPPTAHRFRGWVGSDVSLRAMFASGGVLAKAHTPYLVRPGSGSAEAVERLPVSLRANPAVSPDGKWRFRVLREGLEITDRLKDEVRVLRIPPNQRYEFRSGCCTWLGSDHLLISAPSLGVLSVHSLQYARFQGAARTQHQVEMSDDRQWMLVMADGELSVARITSSDEL